MTRDDDKLELVTRMALTRRPGRPLTHHGGCWRSYATGRVGRFGDLVGLSQTTAGAGGFIKIYMAYLTTILCTIHTDPKNLYFHRNSGLRKFREGNEKLITMNMKDEDALNATLI